jgi:peptidoglycan/LPS O-acetylase OafA/YrhL
MTIDECFSSKSNNFGLLRILAASLVIFSHSFDLLKKPEPLAGLSNHLFSGGSLAVDAFFVLSGFLITASFINGSEIKFISNRVLRIFPALAVACVFTVFVAAPFQTASWADFVFSAPSLDYIKQNTLYIISGVSYVLPGAYESNPFPSSVNGSLWTLQYELSVYVVIFVMGVLGCLKDKILFITALVGLLFIYIGFGRDAFFLTHGAINAELPILCFFIGSLFYVFRASFELSFKVLAIFLFIFYLSEGGLTKVAFGFTLAYIVLFFSLHPFFYIPRFDFKNDYSYGMYVYAFPIQQAIIALGVTSPLLLFVITFGLTSIVSALSWHFVERPALDLRHRLPIS